MPAELLKDLKDVDEGLKKAKEEGDTSKEEKLEKAQAHFGKELQDYKKEHPEEKKESDSNVPRGTNEADNKKESDSQATAKELAFLREYYRDNEQRKSRSEINKKFKLKDTYTEILHRAHKNDNDEGYTNSLKEYRKNNPEMFAEDAPLVKFDNKAEESNEDKYEKIMKGLY